MGARRRTRTETRSRLRAAVAALGASAFVGLLGATPAHASLLYMRGWGDTGSVVIADDSGHDAHRVLTGTKSLLITTARLSPDGRFVAYDAALIGVSNGQRVGVVASNGVGRRTLATGASFAAWSPNSLMIAVIVSSIHRDQLLTINVRTGRTHLIAQAWRFAGVSFSPGGGSIAYAAGPTPEDLIYQDTSDIYTASVYGARQTRLTSDHHSLSPVWGPHAIAYSSWHEVTRAGHQAQIEELYQISPRRRARQLTHSGAWTITALDWSADGRRLLASMTRGGDIAAAAVDPLSGRVLVFGRPPRSRSYSVAPSALSRDGSTILAVKILHEGMGGAQIVTLPYGGGRLHVLASNANDPSWNR